MTNKHVLKARIAALEAELALEEIKGGPGSGNWGHAGRPGKRGGSMPRKVAMSRTSGKDWKERQKAARGDKGEPDKTTRPTGAGQPPKGEAVNNDKAIEWVAEGVTTELKNPKALDVPLTATNESQAQRKAEIVSQLAKKSGLPEETVNGLVKNWAKTSADSDLTALELQAAAARFLGKDPAEYKYIEEKLSEYRDLYPHRKPRVDVAGGHVDVSRDEMDTFIKAMYENTQEQFASAGFKSTDTIRLHRGVSKSAWPDKVDDGDEFTINQNPMSSWSLDWETADQFSWAPSEGSGGIMTMDVPVSSIIGSCKTGVGCLTEVEFVVADTGGHRAVANSEGDID